MERWWSMTPQCAPTRVLFICRRNQWRSPTAEVVFADAPGMECLSAGLNHDAENPLTAELVDWADLIFVMERDHQARLKARFRPQLTGKTVVCLGIPDRYRYMDPALVALLRAICRRADATPAGGRVHRTSRHCQKETLTGAG